MQNVLDLIGRFHPLIVHLPIGILLVAVLFRFMIVRNQGLPLQKALSITVKLGAISAIFACITGYLLSQTADYDEDIVWWHQWLGVGIAVFSLGWVYLLNKSVGTIWSTGIAATVLILLMITGHLGGSLTHGDDYLSFEGGQDTTEAIARKPIPNVQQAVAYTEVIKPILSNSCYSCHGEKKQKGKLRLDMPELIMKGGKNGEVIDTTALTESEMIKRLLLPLSDKKHMPPKDKKQLTKDEISLLHWWVESGASFDRRVNELTQAGKIVPILAALEKPGPAQNSEPALPLKTVERAPQQALDALRKRGVVVLPLAATSNYLSVNYVSADSVNDDDLKLLLPISNQLISLKVGDTKITDYALTYISKCKNLSTLHLQHTAITDKGLSMLGSLPDLQDLNLTGTGVTAEGLLKLKNLQRLRNIYLYQTGVARSSWKQLETAFPAAKLDSGGYVVPILASDTSLVKPLVKKAK